MNAGYMSWSRTTIWQEIWIWLWKQSRIQIVVGRKGEVIALRHYKTTSISENGVSRTDGRRVSDVLYVSFRRPQKATDSRMEGDLMYHYRGEELVGVTILHASQIG